MVEFLRTAVVDYMKLNPEVKTMYDKKELSEQFAIGMF